MTNDPYWTLDTYLFEGTFSYFGNEPVSVRGKLHLAQERFSKTDTDLEIVPLKTKKGMCTYVNLRAYVLVPDITLIIGLYRKPTQQGTIGEVTGSHEKLKMKEQEIGGGQAWYYPEDKIIVLWECGLYRHFEEAPIHQDPNMAKLWSGFEKFLAVYFTEANMVVTTYADPAYPTNEYQLFLLHLGYQPHLAAKGAWSIPIERS